MNARLPKSALPPEATALPLQKDSTVFMSGNSQAVRIPKEFQLSTRYVRLRQDGNALVISPLPMTAAEALRGLPPLSKAEAAVLKRHVQELDDDLLELDDPTEKPARSKPTAKRGQATRRQRQTA